MSVDNLAQFAHVIEQAQSGDNEQRRAAEEAYAQYRSQPDTCLELLLAVLSSPLPSVSWEQQQAEGSISMSTRQFAAVLLRRTIQANSSHLLWQHASPTVQEYTKQQLLALVQQLGEDESAAQQVEDAAAQANDANVAALSAQRKYLQLLGSKVADTISELAVLILDPESKYPGSWQSLLPSLLQLVRSPVVAHRESAFKIFCKVSMYLGTQLTSQSATMREMLHSGLVDEESLRVRIAALEASANILQMFEDPAERLQFQALSPTMLNVVSACLNAGDEESARSAIELFVELAEVDPTFLKPHLDMFVNAMITLATSDSLETGTQQLGVEFLVTLAEHRPSMCRRMPKFVETVLSVLLRMMLQLDEDEGWYLGETEEADEMEPRNSAVGEEGLDRLAMALGGKVIVPQLFSVLPNLLSSEQWEHRYTALIAVSVVGEGCHKVMKPYMDEIVRTITPFFQDAHPRVRWAACNSFGQLCTDFGPDFQKKFHAQMIPNLCHLMGTDVHYPRVQAHAAAASINFCQSADAELLLPYLDDLMAKMMQLLQSESMQCQEQSVTAIAAIADCVKKDFSPYYSSFVPLLKQLLHASADQPALRSLRGKLMECVTLIGTAVGVDQFREDAKDLMDIMLATQSAELKADDPQLQFLLQAWARICRCLKQEFVPYLPYVMPPLMRSASVDPEISVTDAADSISGVTTARTTLSADMSSRGIVNVLDGEAASVPSQKEGWDVIVVGDKRISIHTASMEEKSTACNMLYCYAAELEEGFYNYVDPVARLLVPLMEFYFDDGVRSAAWTTMPALMQCVRMYAERSAERAGTPDNVDRSTIAQFFAFVFPPFMKSIREETQMEEIEGLEIAVEHLAQFISCTGPGVIPQDAVRPCFELAVVLRKYVMERRDIRHREAAAAEDHDAEAQEALEQQDENDADVLLQVGELIGQLARHAPTQFLAEFERSDVPQLLNEMVQSPVPRDRHFALCIFDDMFEHSNTSVLHMLPTMLAQWLHGATDAHEGVRQAAVFGLGVAAQYGGEAVSANVPQILQTLTAVIQARGSREGEAAMCTDNAISAVGKVIEFQAANTGHTLQELLSSWLSFLPVQDDEMEDKIIYGQFCTFLEDPTSSSALLAEGLDRIYSIIGAAYHTESTDDELDQRLASLFTNMQASYPTDITNAALAQIPQETQQLLLAASQAH